MRWMIAVVGIAMVVCSGSPYLQADEESSSTATNYWMTKKLELSQEILAALAMEDFEALADKANQLKRLSRLEGWARRTDAEEYRRELRRFQQAATSLIQQADEQNLDGATLAFHHLTLSCVTCHQHLRSEAEAP